MTGTLSRIPRGRNLVISQLESLGVSVCDEETPSGFGSGISPAATAVTTSVLRSAVRQFSPELLHDLRGAVLRGDVTLHEVRFALSGATLTNEDDIRRVLALTIRLKRAIIALGPDTGWLMKRVHPNTVVQLLRGWINDPT